MARFLFVMLPLTGHLNAALAIGQRLTAAGHQVGWCGAESDLRPLVGPDAPICPTGKRYYRQASETGLAAAQALWDGYLMPFNRFILAPVEQAVADFEPDVLLVDQYALAGGLAGYRAGLPWATLCTGAMELTPPSWQLPGHAEWLADRLDRVWQFAGLPPDRTVDLRFSPYLVLALTGAGLVGDAPLPAHCALVGPALGDRPDDPDFAWHDWDSGRRQVLVTVGTSSDHLAADFYRRTAEALRPLADRVQPVFIAAPAAVPDPPGRALVVDRVPMLDLLPRLAAVVCHGGLGTVTEALAFGVPLVVAPMRHDQPAVARQVVRSGAGLAVDFAGADAAELTAAVTAVLDVPGYATAAGRLATEFAAAGGAARAAELVAGLATAKQI